MTGTRDGEREYPPTEWTVDGVADALRGTHGVTPLTPLRSTATWDRLRTEGRTDAAIEMAEAAQGEPIPDLRASQYLDFARTGDRTRYQTAVKERTDRLTAFVIAECAEGEGRFLDDVLDYVWDVCEDTTWVLPAHLWKEDGLPTSPVGSEKEVTLWRATIGQLLAEVDYLLGDELHPTIGRRVRREVERRLIVPYEEREGFVWLDRPSNNWSAVCHNGVVQAALYLLDDPERIAEIVVEAAERLEWYIEGFGVDGATAEGIDYWNFGFGHYVQLAQHLEVRTDGEYSLLSPPLVEDIARFPLRSELSPGRFPAFSDAIETERIEPYIAGWLGDRLDVPTLSARAQSSFDPTDLGALPEAVRGLLWARSDAPHAEFDREQSTYFSGVQWWIARSKPDDPDGLVLVAKGGHNGESHNHNDCGSFVVHSRGESVLTDLGKPTYDRDFFGDDRYEYLTARSLGHSVPYVNGCEQASGSDHAASVLDRPDDEHSSGIVLELADCYPKRAQLDSLRRTIRLSRRRDGPDVRIEDVATFANADETAFESVLVSYCPVDVEGDGLTIRGDRVHAHVETDAPDIDVSVEHIPDAVDTKSRSGPDRRDVWRARFVPLTPDSNEKDVSVGLSVRVGESS